MLEPSPSMNGEKNNARYRRFTARISNGTSIRKRSVGGIKIMLWRTSKRVPAHSNGDIGHIFRLMIKTKHKMKGMSKNYYIGAVAQGFEKVIVCRLFKNVRMHGA